MSDGPRFEVARVDDADEVLHDSPAVEEVEDWAQLEVNTPGGADELAIWRRDSESSRTVMATVRRESPAVTMTDPTVD